MLKEELFMKKIVWFSRHEPIKKQIDELKRLFGEEVEVVQDPNPFSGADDVVRRFRESGADEMVIVAPLTVIDQITKRGIQPLYAEMRLVENEPDVDVNGRKFVFERFTRIKRVIVEKEELE